MSLQEAVRIAARARRQGKRVVTTNGCFDLLHVGHIFSLERARALGDLLIVGVNSDASVRANKGRGRPIVPARERAQVIAALACVDYVFIFSSKTPIPWIQKLKPAIHAKGADRTREQIVEKAEVEKHGGRVVLIPHTGHSSSNLLRRL